MHPRGSCVARLAAFLLSLTFAAPAYAQQVGLDAQRFVPVGSFRNFVLTHDGVVQPKLKLGFDVTLSGAVFPLQLATSEFGRQEGIIDFLFAGHARAAFAPADWVEIDLLLPFMQFAATGGGLDKIGGGTGSNRVFSLGDVWLEGRFQPLRQEDRFVAVGIVPFVTFPTGNPNIFLTSGLPTFGVKVAASRRWSRVHVAGHFGYRLKPGFAAVGDNVASDDELLYSLGFGVTPLLDRIDVNLELNGAGIVGPGLTDVADQPGHAVTHSPLELLVSGRFRVHQRFDVFAGLGPGVTAGVGTPAFRFFVGMSYAPTRDSDGDGILDAQDACPKDPEDPDAFQDADGCPDLDNDADGVPDATDTCPLVAEDKDSFQDEDGCPDDDNDADGIPDASDLCPDEAEDRDGFQDTDGCPEPDNDGDGIADGGDGCPQVAEDKDGFEDTDGCPEPDNDGDGIADKDDICPNEPENVNGTKDQDGCPDETIAVVSGEKIVILEKILFKYDKDVILKRSFPVLEAVARTLVANPGIRRVRIEGHTDDKGNDEYNQKLSEARATAVMRHLVEAGIDPDRLMAVGYGEIRPLEPNDTEEGRERNRRVEFTILQQDGTGGAGAP